MKFKDFFKKSKEVEIQDDILSEDEIVRIYSDREIDEWTAIEISTHWFKAKEKYSCRNDRLSRHSFAQALLDYSWQESHKNNIYIYDKFGDNYSNSGYARANVENGYEATEIGVGKCFLEPYFWGWSFAEKLNLKCNASKRIDISLKR